MPRVAVEGFLVLKTKAFLGKTANYTVGYSWLFCKASNYQLVLNALVS